jgi:cytochrome c oxidase cbb3-type subunit 3
MRARSIACAALFLALVGCDREKRELRPQPADRAVMGPANRNAPQVQIPGAQTVPEAMGGPLRAIATRNPQQGNSFTISEGQRLYHWFNCAGCHSEGGGGIGPSLMDQVWVYGGTPDKIYESIAKGRPHGMPAWGSKIPEFQIWQLVAYVRSLSGQQPRPTIPARGDSIEVYNTDILKRKQAP